MYLEMQKYTKIIDGETVINNVNLSMELGRIYGLRGRNGSGKTMIMRAICGLIKPTSGEVRINNKIIGKDISFPESIGAHIENTGFIDNYTAFQNLRLIADIKGIISDDHIRDVLASIGLDPYGKKKYKKFSLGMKQKLGIASAIMESPQIIILDEPTNALDEESIKKMHAILQEHKKHQSLIIISSHDMEELKYLADEIIIIENGAIKKNEEVVEGSVKNET